jgi:rhodanese-related sulfurtransferase
MDISVINYLTKMKRFLLPVFLLGLALVVVSCGKPTAKKISIPEAETLMQQKGDKLQIVDLRTPQEVNASGIIPGAQVINISSNDFAGKIGQLDKSSPVLLYCAAGSRSASAAAIMHKQGFCEIYDLSAGMSGWQAAGKTTIK